MSSNAKKKYIFKKVRIRMNRGRGDEELFQDFLANYAEFMEEINSAPEEDKEKLKEDLNEIVDGLGDALFQNK